MSARSIGIYKHDNPNRDRFWIQRYKPTHIHIRKYTPTPSSRKRIARVIHSMKPEQVKCQRYNVWIFRGIAE